MCDGRACRTFHDVFLTTDSEVLFHDANFYRSTSDRKQEQVRVVNQESHSHYLAWFRSASCPASVAARCRRVEAHLDLRRVAPHRTSWKRNPGALRKSSHYPTAGASLYDSCRQRYCFRGLRRSVILAAVISDQGCRRQAFGRYPILRR